MPILLGLLAVIGLDLWVSYVRMRRYGPRVELNPVAREFAADHGPVSAVVYLAVWNLALVFAIVYYFPVLLPILFGFKLGIAAMQLKSLEIESFVERLLRKAKEKKSVT